MNFTTRMVMTTIDGNSPCKSSVLTKLLAQWVQLASALEERLDLENDQFLIWKLTALPPDHICASVDHCRKSEASNGPNVLVSAIAESFPVMIKLAGHKNILVYANGFRNEERMQRDERIGVDEQVTQILNGFNRE